MELKTTLGQIIAMDQALDRFLAERWPIKAAHTLTNISEAVKKEATYAKAEQDKWIRELGTETAPTPAQRAEGTSAVFEVQPDRMPEFFGRLSELYAIPVTLNIQPLSLKGCEMVSVFANDVACLAAVITEDP